nr:hypothetical protein [Tanacetum cinerariifolium]
MCDMVGQFIQKKEEEKQIEEEQAARYWKILACYDDDDGDYTFAITPNEPDNSLSMGDEHLDTILATDDQSFFDEDVPNKIFSNPLFDEEIISMKMDPHHFNAESDLIESLLNHDSSIISSSSKIDSLFDEFADELAHLKSIPSGIDETDCDPEEETYFIKDILILEEFLSNNSLSLPENESFHFDIPSFSRPLSKPPDGNTGILNVNVMGDISEQKVLMPRLMITLVPN